MAGQDVTPNPFADEAHLGKPINLGISGIQHVLRCVKDGTTEVRDLIFNECELLFECKACRNMFRQLPNFLYHKREFCKKHYCESMMAFTAEDVPEEILVVQPDSPKSNNDNDNELEPMDEPMDETGAEENEAPVETITLPTSVPKIYQPNTKHSPMNLKDPECTTGRSSAAIFYNNCLKTVERRTNMAPKKALISLLTIKSNPNAMYQTVTQNEKSDGTTNENTTTTLISLADVRQQIEDSRTAVITQEEIRTSTRKQRQDNSDGTGSVILRLKNRVDCSVDNLTCLTCRIRYQTAKTLDFHMRSVHSDTRLYYPCPYCSTSFVQIWSVMRHITTIHKKTKEQSYKMKDLIKSRGFRKNPVINKNNMKPNEKLSQINQKQNANNPYSYKENELNTKRNNTTSSRGEIINAICNRQSLLKTNVLHIVREDSEKKKNKNYVVHVCSKCGRSFARKSSQTTHERYCSAKPEEQQQQMDNRQRMKTITTNILQKSLLLPKLQPVEEDRNPKPILNEPKAIKLEEEESQPAEKESSGEGSSRPKRNAKKKEQVDFIPVRIPGTSRANNNNNNNVNRPRVSNLLHKLNLSSDSGILEKKVTAIIDVKKLRCLKCNRRFSTFSNLRRHAAIHIGWNRYKCKYCEYMSYNRSDCRSHIRRNHLHGRYPLAHVDKLVVDLPPESPPLATIIKSLKLSSSPTTDNSQVESSDLNKISETSSRESLDGNNSNISESSESVESAESSQTTSPLVSNQITSETESSHTKSSAASVQTSSEAESTQTRSPVAVSVQNSLEIDSPQPKSSDRCDSAPLTPKRAKRSKEQCLYEGKDAIFSLKTRSGSYPKKTFLGRNLINSLEPTVDNFTVIKTEDANNSDQQPSTSNANLVPTTSSTHLKNSMTSKIQKFIYVHDDFLPQLKAKSILKPQPGALS